MNKKDALNASTKLTATYEQLYIIYKQSRGEIENSFLKNSNYIEFLKINASTLRRFLII